MSAFVFGYVNGGSTRSADEVATLLVDLADRAGLYSFVGPNVSQSIVREMLTALFRWDGQGVPFLLTRTPNDDTSESLFEPSGPELDYVKSVSNGVREVLHWFAGVLQQSSVVSAGLASTYGFEDECDKVFTPINAKALMEVDSQLSKDHGPPSFLIRVGASYLKNQ